MIKKLIAGVFVLSFGLVASATTVVTNDTEVTITADANYTYTDRLDSNTTVLNLAGGNEITLAAVDNSFAGTVNLTAGKVVFVNGTFSAGATIDGATLNVADGTYAVMSKVPAATPIPWKFVATSGTVHLSGRGTVGSAGPDVYDRWGGTVSLAKGVTLYIDGEDGGIITYGINSASSASATWIDGAIEGEGVIKINNNTGGKGVLGLGNPNTVKNIGGFQGLYDSFRMVNAGNVIFKTTYHHYRDQRPYNINTRLSIVSNTFVTSISPKTIGYSGYSRASYLDIRDGAVVSNRIDLGVSNGNQGTVFLTSADAGNPSRAYFCQDVDDVNIIGNVRSSVNGVPDANSQYPGSGYVMLRNGIAEFDRPVELGRSSRGYIDIRTGGQVITRGTNSSWCVGGHQKYTPKLTDSCHGAIRVGAGGLFRSEGDILLTYGTRADIGGGAEMRDVGHGELTVSGAGATAEVREIALMFGRQDVTGWADLSLPGSVGFVNIRDGGVLTASRIYRDAIDSDVRQTGQTTSSWGKLTESQYVKSCLYLNFAGGTLKIASSGRFFIPLSGQYEGTKDTMRYPTRVTVYSGGATIDTDGHDVIWDVPIVNAKGKIVASNGITMPNGYTANHPRRVRIISTTGDGHSSSVSVWSNYTDENTCTLPKTYEVTSPGFDETMDDLVALVEDQNCVLTTNGTVGLVWATGSSSTIPPESYSFTKKGAGTLTLKGANDWIGPTRIDAGTLAFTDATGLPVNSMVEIASSALANGVAPLKVVKYTGGEIHIVGATLDDAWFQKQAKILVSDTALTSTPTVKLYGADGAELDTTGWILDRSTDGKVVKFGKVRTEDLTITNPDIVRGSIDVIGTFAVTNDEFVTVTATPNNHALVGWNVDGEFVAAGDRLTYDYRANLSKVTLSLSPVFSTNLYVNANAEDDSGDGMTPATAKKTLASIAALAIPGDVIHAARGTYDKGYSDVVTGYTPYITNCGASKFSNARVSLAEGVSLVADEGPAVTTIVGLADPICEYSDNPTGGCGTNSLRCVVARANTYLKGFTIKDGYTRGFTGSITDANAGGCILAPSYDVDRQRAGTLLVEDCRISNGNSRSGCCVAGGIYVRCVIKNGVSFSWSGPRIGYMARFIDCVLYQNSESMLQDPRGVYNTFAYSDGTLGEDFSGTSEDYPVVNSVVYTAGIKSESTAKLKYFKNCYVQFMSNRVSLDEETCENCVTTNGPNYSVDFTMLGFNNAHDQPTGLLATSPLIDAGDSTLVPAECLTGDVDGLQRIWNGLVDIGPFEYAPTNEYTAAVCGRRATVTGASEMVTTNATGEIAIPADGSLSIAWKGREGTSKKVKLTVSALTEGSRLLVYKGDTPEATITVAGTVEIESAAALTNLRLVAEGGTVTISSVKPDLYGTLMILQ